MESDGEFYRAKARSQMAAGTAYHINHHLTDLSGKYRQSFRRKSAQVSGRVD
jgi:hypothetical protein